MTGDAPSLKFDVNLKPRFFFTHNCPPKKKRKELAPKPYYDEVLDIQNIESTDLQCS